MRGVVMELKDNLTGITEESYVKKTVIVAVPRLLEHYAGLPQKCFGPTNRPTAQARPKVEGRRADLGFTACL
jgi:hypothetical protein